MEKEGLFLQVANPFFGDSHGIININNGLICAIALFQKVLYFSGIIIVIYCMRHLKQVAYSFVNKIEVNHN